MKYRNPKDFQIDLHTNIIENEQDFVIGSVIVKIFQLTGQYIISINYSLLL